MAKILVVEDDPTLLKFYAELLKGAGYDVDQASDGEIAIRFCLQGGYDLILMDFMLPKKDGLSVLADLVKEKPTLPNKKIILLTNLGEVKSTVLPRELGISKILTKSALTPEQFLEEIKTALQ